LLHISFSSGASPKVDAGGRAITIMPLFAGFPLSVNITLEKCAFIALQNSTKLVSATETMFSY
jgi:hypothetical protein